MKKVLLAALLLLFAAPHAHMQDSPKINKRNLVVKEWITSSQTGKRYLDHVTVYNSDRKKIEETEYGVSGQKWKKRYEYGKNGKCVKVLVYDEHNRLVSYKTFEYNEYGRKKVQYSYDAKGRLKSVKNFEYLIADDK